MSDEPRTEPERIPVWDWQTRAFHWLLVMLIGLMWLTAENDWIDLHIALGLTMLGLLLFRLVWGLIGGSTARFANFLRGPGAVLDDLRGHGAPVHGHNPLGGWSVALMLILLFVQVGLGLFASDEDGFDAGPLAHLVSLERSQWLLEKHDTLFNILLGVIGLHVLAVLYYWLRGDNLVRPMIDGRRAAADGLASLQPAPAWRFVLAVVLAAALPLWLAL